MASLTFFLRTIHLVCFQNCICIWVFLFSCRFIYLVLETEKLHKFREIKAFWIIRNVVKSVIDYLGALSWIKSSGLMPCLLCENCKKKL